MYIILTHWGRVTHMCVSELTGIGSDNSIEYTGQILNPLQIAQYAPIPTHTTNITSHNTHLSWLLFLESRKIKWICIAWPVEPFYKGFESSESTSSNIHVARVYEMTRSSTN